MDDVKDKFKGFMKKMAPSSSGKFKGQAHVLGSSSSGPTNSTLNRPYVNPKSNPTCSPSKPHSLKDSNPNTTQDSARDRLPKDGFDPFDSLITTGNRNMNGYQLTNIFECPICGSAFTSEEHVSAHIEFCIDNNTKNADTQGAADDVDVANLDLPSLSVAADQGKKPESTDRLEGSVGVYLSGNPSHNSVHVILRLLRNIVKEPENSKFRKIRMSNPKIREAIGEVTGGVELLEIVGFELKQEEGDMWAVMDTPSEESVLMIKDAVMLLEQTKDAGKSSSTIKQDGKIEQENVKESEPKVVDRQIKVFFSVPENVAARIELPDSFYNRSADELRREAELRKKKLAESQLLIPKSFREKQAQAARKKYNRALIRVQFPDGVVLQGVFSPREPTSALYEFVSSALKQEGLEFELIHPIPVKRRLIPCFPSAGEKASTLEEEDLVPSALVKFKPLETDSMVFTGLKNELLEISEPLGSNTS